MTDLTGDLAIAAAVLDQASVPVALLGTDGVVRNCNSSFARACGRPSGELLGAVLADTVVADDRVGFHSTVAANRTESDDDSEGLPSVEVRFVGADGRVRPARLNLGLLTNEIAHTLGGSAEGTQSELVLCIATDRSEERRSERANRRARVESANSSMTDPATGLLNERGIELTMESASRRAGRHGSAFALIHCLLTLDKDQDDRSLTETLVAACVERIRQRLRPSDTVARSGDAVVVVAEDLGDEQDAVGVTYRVLSTVVEPIPTDSGAVELRMRAGTVVADETTPLHKLTPAAIEAATRADTSGGIELVDLRRSRI